jgi:hypothetical protein
MPVTQRERRIADAHDRLCDTSATLCALHIADPRDITATLKAVDTALVSLNQARNLLWLARRNDEVRILVSDVLSARPPCAADDEHRLTKSDLI